MNYELARQNMVKNQIRPNGVTNHKVLNAMASIPREMFVPDRVCSVAYGDKAIYLGRARYLMAPMLYAKLLQEANISMDDIVLNIGCGSGYSTAVLAKISKAVVGVEIDPDLAKKASSLMVELGIDNVLIIEKKLVNGYVKQAPYDVIIIDGSVEQVPKQILDQIADGGRLVTVITDAGGPKDSMGRVVIRAKYGDLLSEIVAFDAYTPPLLDFQKETYFKL